MNTRTGEHLRSSVSWAGDAIEIIDQTLLPAEERILRAVQPHQVITTQPELDDESVDLVRAEDRPSF